MRVVRFTLGGLFVCVHDLFHLRFIAPFVSFHSPSHQMLVRIQISHQIASFNLQRLVSLSGRKHFDDFTPLRAAFCDASIVHSDMAGDARGDRSRVSKLVNCFQVCLSLLYVFGQECQNGFHEQQVLVYHRASCLFPVAPNIHHNANNAVERACC